MCVIGAFVAVTALTSLVYWPGQMDPDTQDELNQAASGHFSDWHTPILSALWRIPYVMGLHTPGVVLAAGLFSFLIGFYLILRVRFDRLAAASIAILCFAWPPVLSWSVHIGRDSWFAATCLCAFGFAARMMRMGNVNRSFNLIAAAFFAFLCCASWQIALAPLFALFVLLASQLLRREIRHRTLKAFAAGLVACVALFAVQVGLEKAIQTKSVHIQQGTYVYDLAQLSKQEGRNLFPAAVLVPHRHPMAVLRTTQTGWYDQFVFGRQAIVKFPVEGSREVELQHAWLTAVFDNPLGYLRERTDLGLAQLAITHPAFWTYQVPPDGPQFEPVSTGLRNGGLDYFALFAVGGNLYGDPLYSVWAYALVAAVGAPLLYRRRGPGDLAVAALGVAAVLFLIALIFTVPGLIYRYGFPLVTFGTVMAPVLLPRPSAKRRRSLGWSRMPSDSSA